MDVDRMHSNVPDEEDDEFVTPRECFDSSGKKIARRPHNQKAVQKLRGEPRNHQNKVLQIRQKHLIICAEHNERLIIKCAERKTTITL